MGIFKEVKNTVRNIFNADDDVLFEDEQIFDDKKNDGSAFSRLPFGNRKKDDSSQKSASNMTLPTFDALNHNFNAAQNAGRSGANKKSNGRIQVYVPKSFEESFNIIKDIRGGSTAMVNVETANPQVAQRIIDVISGAMYALDGYCKKIGEKQYIFSLSTETVGGYDYLPVNGVSSQNQNMGFNFNNPIQQPFNYFGGQQNNLMGDQNIGFQQNMNQNAGFNMPNVNGYTQNNQNQYFNNNMGNNFSQNNNSGFDSKNSNNDFYIPPQSQF